MAGGLIGNVYALHTVCYNRNYMATPYAMEL